MGGYHRTVSLKIMSLLKKGDDKTFRYHGVKETKSSPNGANCSWGGVVGYNDKSIVEGFYLCDLFFYFEGDKISSKIVYTIGHNSVGTSVSGQFSSVLN